MSLISIVIPTQNRPDLLDETLVSVTSQTLAPSEIIIIDDGSSPPVDTLKLKEKFGETIVVFRNDVARGLAFSRNFGVEMATADYVVHLDDDDLYASDALEAAYSVLSNDPSLDLVFIGAIGFGASSEHFNRVQPDAVNRVIALGGGQETNSGLVYFDRSLFKALLHSVPIAFQRVMLRRETWHKIGALRRSAYRLNPGVIDDEAAKRCITGPLRDSEWALYAGVVCNKTALINRPLYLQRCARQGYSSQPANKALHRQQNLIIKNQLLRASQALPEFLNWKSEIRNSVATVHFDAAYAFFKDGNRCQSWQHLWQALTLRPHARYFKFAIRTLFP